MGCWFWYLPVDIKILALMSAAQQRCIRLPRCLHQQQQQAIISPPILLLSIVVFNWPNVPKFPTQSTLGERHHKALKSAEEQVTIPQHHDTCLFREPATTQPDNKWLNQLRCSFVCAASKHWRPSVLWRWPSVLWRCWLGVRKGIRPVKIWLMSCWHGYLLERSANRWHMVQLMPLPRHHVCFSKIQNGLSF